MTSSRDVADALKSSRTGSPARDSRPSASRSSGPGRVLTRRRAAPGATLQGASSRSETVAMTPVSWHEGHRAASEAPRDRRSRSSSAISTSAEANRRAAARARLHVAHRARQRLRGVGVGDAHQQETRAKLLDHLVE